MRVGQAALPHQRHDRREPRGLDQGEQLGGGVGVEDAAAGVDDRLLRLDDRLRRLAHLPLVNLRRRAPAGQVDLGRVREVDLGLLGVLGDVDEHGAGPAGAGDVEGVLDRLRQLAGIQDEPRMLDDRHRDAGGVGLLEGVGADQVRPDLAGDADERRRVHPRVGDRGHEIGRTGARGRQRDSDLAGGARVALGHVAGALLVAAEHVPYGRAPRDCVVGRQDRPTGDPEHDIDAFCLERAQDGVGAEHSRHRAPFLDLFTVILYTLPCSCRPGKPASALPSSSRSTHLSRCGVGVCGVQGRVSNISPLAGEHEMVTTNMPESGARIGFAAETMMATSLPKTDCGVKRVLRLLRQLRRRRERGARGARARDRDRRSASRARSRASPR